MDFRKCKSKFEERGKRVFVRYGVPLGYAAAIDGLDGPGGQGGQTREKWHVVKKRMMLFPVTATPRFSCHEDWIHAIVRWVRPVRHVRQSRRTLNLH